MGYKVKTTTEDAERDLMTRFEEFGFSLSLNEDDENEEKDEKDDKEEQ